MPRIKSSIEALDPFVLRIPHRGPTGICENARTANRKAFSFRPRRCVFGINATRTGNCFSYLSMASSPLVPYAFSHSLILCCVSMKCAYVFGLDMTSWLLVYIYMSYPFLSLSVGGSFFHLFCIFQFLFLLLLPSTCVPFIYFVDVS